METNIVFLKQGMGMVDFYGEIRILSEEEKNEYWGRKDKREMRIFWIGVIIFFLLVYNLCSGAVWIYNIASSHFKKSPTQINYYIGKTAKDLKKKEIKIRAIIPDNADPSEVKDKYISNLLDNSNIEFGMFFNGTNRKLQEGITIFFIDQKYWDGEKACNWNKAGGCNINDEEKNLIVIPLSQNLVQDLRTLDHERTHAYFLKEPEIVAHLVENLFTNGFNLSGKSFNLYKDDQGRLRF